MTKARRQTVGSIVTVGPKVTVHTKAGWRLKAELRATAGSKLMAGKGKAITMVSVSSFLVSSILGN